MEALNHQSLSKVRATTAQDENCNSCEKSVGKHSGTEEFAEASGDLPTTPPPSLVIDEDRGTAAEAKNHFPPESNISEDYPQSNYGQKTGSVLNGGVKARKQKTPQRSSVKSLPVDEISPTRQRSFPFDGTDLKAIRDAAGSIFSHRRGDIYDSISGSSSPTPDDAAPNAKDKPLSPTIGKQRRSASKIQPITVDPLDGQTPVFECPLCRQHLTTNHALTIHIRNHNHEKHSGAEGFGERKLSPGSRSPESADDRSDGGQSSSLLPSPINHSCTICGKFLSSQSSLDRHMLVHSGERPFVCPLCSMAFTTNGNMHRHLRIHEREGTTTAEEIQEKYSGRGNRGRKRKNVAPVDAEKKSNVGSNGEKAGQKMEKLNGKKKRSDFEKHNATSTEKNDKNTSETSSPLLPSRFSPASQLTCPICSKTFLSEIGYKMHVEEHNLSKMASACPDCDATFTTPQAFTLHYQTAHAKPRKPMGFGDLSYLDFSSHKFREMALQRCNQDNGRIASSQFHTFKCHICEKAFPSVAVLRMHIDHDHNDIFKTRNLTRLDCGGSGGATSPTVALNLVSKSTPIENPLATQDHILDLSKKRNTTYYDQINLIKEHTTPRDTLEKVALMLSARYSTEGSVRRDIQRGGLAREIFSGSSSSNEDKESKAVDMQISPNVVGIASNREGDGDEESGAVPEDERHVNVVDDEVEDNQPLSLLKIPKT